MEEWPFFFIGFSIKSICTMPEIIKEKVIFISFEFSLGDSIHDLAFVFRIHHHSRPRSVQKRYKLSKPVFFLSQLELGSSLFHLLFVSVFFLWGWKRIQVLWGVCLFITLIVYHCTKRSIRPSLIILKKCVLFQFCCFCCRWLCYISWYNGIDKNVTKIEALLTVHFLNKDNVITVVSIEIYSS